MTSRSSRILAAAGLAIALTTQVPGQAVTWDGDCGTFWLAACGPGNATTSWDNDMFPGPTDDVTINGATVSMNTAEDVNTFTLNGGGLSIGGARTLTSNNGGSASGATILGRFKTFGTYTFAGSNTFSGELYGPGMFVNSGMLTLSGISIGDSVGTPTTFQNDGTVDLPFAPDVRANSEFINNGTMSLPSEIRGQGRFVNNGDIVVPQPESGFILTNDFRMLGGTVTVDQSQLTFGNESRYTGGTMTARAGGLIRFLGTGINHTFDGLSEFNGQGVISMATGGFAGHRFEAPLTFNMTGDGQAQLSGFGFVSTEITNTGNILFAGERFEQGGGGSFVNEAGGVMEVAQDSASRLISDIPIINRGRAVQLSGVTSLTPGVFVDVTNASGGEWEMVSLPGSGIFFNNAGTVYRRAVDGAPARSGSIANVYNQTDALTRLEAAVTTFEGSGTWINSELEVLDAARAIFNASSGTFSFEGDCTIKYAGVDDVVRVSTGANTQFGVSGTLRFVGASNDPLGGVAIPVRIGGTILGEGEVINQGDMALDAAWRLGGSIGGGTFRNQGGLFIGGSAAPSPRVTMDVVNAGVVDQFGDVDIEIGAIENQGQWNLLNGVNLNGTTTFTNTGELRAAGGTTFEEIGPTLTLDNQGTVRVAFLQTTLTLRGPVAQLTGGTLTGGSWIVEPGCRLVFPAGTVLNTIGPGATVAGSTDDIPDIESVERVEGTVDGTGPLRVAGGLAIENGGQIIVRPPEGMFDSIEVPDEFRVENAGNRRGGSPSTLTLTNTRADGSVVSDACTNPITIRAASFVNEDLVVVGPAGEIVAADINAPTTLAPTSTIQVDIAGPSPCTQHDQLSVNGSVVSGGTIELTLRDGYVPEPPDSFDIITATAGVSGDVPAVVTTNPDPSVRLVGSVGPNAVRVMAFCAADTNLDGVVSPADFNAWVLAFNTQSPACDQNADGLCTPADLNAWILNFNSGCS